MGRKYFAYCAFMTFLVVSEGAFSESFSPYVDQNYPTNVWFGDTHVHTSMSQDSSSYGNKKIDQEQAYRLAKGESVVVNNGMTAKLRNPLDFIVLSEHAEGLGFTAALRADDPRLKKTKTGRELLHLFNAKEESNRDEEKKELNDALFSRIWGASRDQELDAYTKYFWQKVARKADFHNEPGIFTAFIGFEWTPIPLITMGDKTLPSNLHRNVIFADNAQKVSTVLPFTMNDSEDPEDLWVYMESYEKKTGGSVFAIPHNGNLSVGEMFKLESWKGEPLSANYAKARSRWEPLYEVTQVKGDSEVFPLFSPDDEFADYETWTSWEGVEPLNSLTEEERQSKQYEYARSALKLGLAQQQKLGANPFKFGLIGSTDSHTGLATADENNFWGKMTSQEPSKTRWKTPIGGWLPNTIAWEHAASGYAAVWAQENTRESLFTAMKRKEVYATTGPRMTVRFFGGWNYDVNDAFKADLAKIGYQKGVPMGGDLTNAPLGKSPQFLIRAVRDPDGANLDRVQVIKGWHDKHGELHEKIYNVALSDNRKNNSSGKAKPVGSTVDITDASYTNTIGDPELAVVWQDPDFNKDELAFYYVRVLEIPTPRWTAYDAKYFGINDIPDEVPMVTQERAYTSPIWYSPSRW